VATPAEFEEKSYELPLYNQLERGAGDLFPPGQVLEHTLGFDAGLFMANQAIWETLGYKSVLQGAALAYYDWPHAWRLPRPGIKLPRFRLNLFLQVNRPLFHKRRPRALKSIESMRGPLWSFPIDPRQQRRLEVLAGTLGGRAHVAYASAAFHTYTSLYRHIQCRTLPQNSTFPSVDVLSGHEAWYYRSPGAQGAANPNPESIEQPSLFARLDTLAREIEPLEAGDLKWLDLTARSVIAAAAEGTGTDVDSQTAHFFNDLQTLDRLTERYGLQPNFLAYAQVNLFTIRFGLHWLVMAEM
jgi:hypothetical protein